MGVNLKGNNKERGNIIDIKSYYIIDRISKPQKQWCSERIIQIDKHLGQGKKKTTEKTQITHSRNEKVIYHRFYKISQQHKTIQHKRILGKEI